MKVALVGIELEGGWNRIPPAVESGSRRFVTDGSVRVGGAIHRGELTSAPIPPEGIADFVLANYPCTTGPCCGLHIHMSFGNAAQNAAAIAALAEREQYQTDLIAGLTAWGRAANVTLDRFWSRLGGSEQYCRTDWTPQAWRGSHGRYFAVNFAAWDRHKTLEVRVLPMFKSKSLAAKALGKVVDITNAYLANVGTAEVELEYTMPEPEPIVETIETVLGADGIDREES